ncbi:MAG: DUF1501 domain-containing protein [Planctomycetales bacterium]|nr:DUF1501 domain-containing protein [Planctomycetales bacterium]
MLSILGPSRSACNQVSRREILQVAGAGLLGLSLPKVLQAESLLTGSARAKSVIFMFLFGGPSQLETFDMKPEAPDRIRGPFKPISSRTPGLIMCEHLPQLANISDKYCVVRTMTHNFNDHSGGGHYIQTGHRWHVPIGGGFSPTPKDWPSMGSIVEYVDQHSANGLSQPIPSYLVVPNSLGRLQEKGQFMRPGEHAGWLGRRYNPLTTKVDKHDLKDNPYWRDCADSELTFEVAGLAAADQVVVDRIKHRASLLDQLEQAQRGFENGGMRDFDRFRQRAYALITSEETRQAFNIRQESAQLRDRYGRHLLGQSALVARRLIEAGARFVTVHYDCVDGYSWDSHLNSKDVKDHLLPTFDQALSALLVDLEARGLLDETLVVAMGEMGRTPQANDNWGRGHWSTLFPAVLAGAGIRGGAVYGTSDKDAAYPIDHPVSPEDLAATIYDALGINYELRLPDALGRPVPIIDGGHPVRELFG